MSLRRLVFVVPCAFMPFAQAADYDIDTSFGSNGWKRMYETGGGSQDDKGVAFARTADGGYVIVAELPNGGANGGNGKRIGLFRLDRDGDYVASGFGVDGRAYKDAWLTSVTAMTIDAQGRIIVVGATPGPGGLSDFGVVRFNADGSDDTSFAGDGGTSFGFDVAPSPNSDDAPTSVLAEADGKIVVAGNVQYASLPSRFGVVRLNVDGSLDTTFGNIGDGHGGHLGTDGSFGDGHAAYASQIVHIDGGYFVLTGTSVLSGTDTDFGAAILTPNGSPWSGFAGTIEVAVDEPGPGGSLYDTVTATAVASPTSVVLAGTSSKRLAAVRLVASKNGVGQYVDLNVDPGFAGSANSVYLHRFVGAYDNDHPQAVGVRSDGRILIAGRWSDSGGAQYGTTTRLMADGSADEGYSTHGTYAIPAPTLGGTQTSYYSEFKGVLFDHNRTVLMGSASDSTTSANDLDVVVTRRQSDLIFFDGFQQH